MRRTINDLIAHIQALEDELETELIARRRELGVRWKEGRAVFGRELTASHHKLKMSAGRFLAKSGLLEILTSPFIYAVAIPVALLDLTASLFQAICFRVYGLRQVKRREYLVFDRHRLPYLNVLQKINCLYCSYANGVLAYVHEIASRTEQYWCPIKHAERVKGTHRRYAEFLDYGDTENYPETLEQQRARLKAETEET
ncbi:hypothetical protein [Glycocaulis sp.]|uniref:hypothetical protein n=1 Tax=Glycocaulis sp. TaxID=1969725 RepID=UPI003F70DB36